MEVLIRVPMELPSGNAMRRKYRHFSAYGKLRDSWQRTIFALAGRKNTQLLRARVDLKHKAKVLILSQRKKLLDKDNLYAGAKPILDSLVRLNYCVDDSAQWMDVTVDQEKSNESSTVISITYGDE